MYLTTDKKEKPHTLKCTSCTLLRKWLIWVTVSLIIWPLFNLMLFTTWMFESGPDLFTCLINKVSLHSPQQPDGNWYVGAWREVQWRCHHRGRHAWLVRFSGSIQEHLPPHEGDCRCWLDVTVRCCHILRAEMKSVCLCFRWTTTPSSELQETTPTTSISNRSSNRWCKLLIWHRLKHKHLHS